MERGAMWQRGWGAERGWVERRWVGSVGGVGLVRAGRAGEELRRCLRCSGAGARLAHSSGVSPCRGGGVCIHLSSRWWVESATARYAPVAQATAYARKHCSQSLDSGKGGRETPVAGQQTDSTRAETRARQVSSSQRGCGTRGAAVECGCCAMRVWASQGCTQVERGAMWQRGWGAERGWVERRWVGSVGGVGLVRGGACGGGAASLSQVQRRRCTPRPQQRGQPVSRGRGLYSSIIEVVG